MVKSEKNAPEKASALFHAAIKVSVKGNPKPKPMAKKKTKPISLYFTTDRSYFCFSGVYIEKIPAPDEYLVWVQNTFLQKKC